MNYDEYYWGKRNCHPYSGLASGWAIGAGSTGSGLVCGSNYADFTNAWMVYGPFNLADATDAELTFSRWSQTEYQYDTFFGGASVNGTNFFGSQVTGNWASWNYEEFDLTTVNTLGDLRGQSAVWIAFVLISDESKTLPEGAYIDDVVVKKTINGQFTQREPTVAIDTLSKIRSRKFAELQRPVVDGMFADR